MIEFGNYYFFTATVVMFCVATVFSAYKGKISVDKGVFSTYKGKVSVGMGIFSVYKVEFSIYTVEVSAFQLKFLSHSYIIS